MAEVRTPPRRLVDLNPRWGSGTFHGVERRGIALNFDCPCQSPTCEWGGTMSVAIENPIDGGAREGGWKTYWQRTGDTFETLTLSPSIHAVGHWHGWLRNGVVESC